MTLGATITNEGGDVHDKDFGFDQFDRGNIAGDVLNNFSQVKSKFKLAEVRLNMSI